MCKVQEQKIRTGTEKNKLYDSMTLSNMSKIRVNFIF